MLGLMQCARSSPSTVISRCSGQRGYTLIEMLVVVMIVGMIVVVAIPNLRRAKVRADLLDDVKMLRQSVAIARINAVKYSRRVVLRILEDAAVQQGGLVIAWVDDNADESMDGGEEVVGRWLVNNNTFLAPDSTDASRLFHVLTGTNRGVVFLPNGTSIANSTATVGVGVGAVIVSDRNSNQIRLSIQAGAATVIEEMWNPTAGAWAREERFCIY